LKVGGAVIAWGDGRFGGSHASVQQQLNAVVLSIHPTKVAFAAMKTDGAVITWGHRDHGGNSACVREHLAPNLKFIESAVNSV